MVLLWTSITSWFSSDLSGSSPLVSRGFCMFAGLLSTRFPFSCLYSLCLFGRWQPFRRRHHYLTLGTAESLFPPEATLVLCAPQRHPELDLQTRCLCPGTHQRCCNLLCSVCLSYLVRCRPQEGRNHASLLLFHPWQLAQCLVTVDPREVFEGRSCCIFRFKPIVSLICKHTYYPQMIPF